MATFKQRLKSLREEAKLTQSQFAKLIGFGESTIAMYETGEREPNHGRLKTIATFFGCTIDYLLGISGQRHYMDKVAREPAEYNNYDVFDIEQLTANMEAEYGEKPSPEMIAAAKTVYQRVLKNTAKIVAKEVVKKFKDK